ncbi:uncharacterized protein LOC131251658 [Magnolia sinica]|uniref:uncharacterized protein LOC131251658 n=1 Tax=Magnolia sinica TaxID=86752 RepID=UPI00265863D6|nr:uncharacterized protein LOC131251658 [Magnolia sinica]
MDDAIATVPPITGRATVIAFPAINRVTITTSPMTRSRAKSLSPEVLAQQAPSPVRSASLSPVKTAYKGKQTMSEEDSSLEYSANTPSSDTSFSTSLTDKGDVLLNQETEADVDIEEEDGARAKSPPPDIQISRPDVLLLITMTSLEEEQLDYGESGYSPGANIFLSFDASYSPCIVEAVDVIAHEASTLREAEAQSSEIQTGMENILLPQSTGAVLPMVTATSDAPIHADKSHTARPLPIQPVARSLEFFSYPVDVPTPTTLDSSTGGAQELSFNVAMATDVPRSGELGTCSVQVTSAIASELALVVPTPNGSESSNSVATVSDRLSLEKVSAPMLVFFKNVISVIVSAFKDPA